MGCREDNGEVSADRAGHTEGREAAEIFEERLQGCATWRSTWAEGVVRTSIALRALRGMLKMSKIRMKDACRFAPPMVDAHSAPL